MSRYSYDSTTQQETLIAGNTYYANIKAILLMGVDGSVVTINDYWVRPLY